MPVRRAHPAVALLVMVGAIGSTSCTVDRGGLGLGADAGGARDSGSSDGAVRDAGADAGRRDAGRGDAGRRDAGSGDAGRRADAGRDAGTDAGPPPLPVTSDLLVHFDALDVNGDGTTPTGSVSTWEDLSGGNDGACTDVAYEPDGLSAGRPAVRTNGIAGSRCQFDIPDLGDVSIFVVFRTDDTRSAGNWYLAPTVVGGDSPNRNDDAAMYMSGGRLGFARREGGLQFSSTTSYADDAPHAVSLVRIASSGAVSLRVDRDAAIEGTADDGDITLPDHWWLASHASANDGRFDARYAEVLVYDRALSPAEVDAVRGYLLSRWGL